MNFSEFEEKLATIILISGMSVLFVYLISKNELFCGKDLILYY
jgi:hypothetical protein